MANKGSFKKGNKLGKKFEKGNKFALGIKWNHSKKTKEKMSLERRGKNNPAWRGGISLLVARIRRSFKYRQWRSDVFTRDGFTCQECGKIDCLEAHHIDRFIDIIKRNEIKTLEQALDCENLWNINNGETLCEECHHRKSP